MPDQGSIVYRGKIRLLSISMRYLMLLVSISKFESE